MIQVRPLLPTDSVEAITDLLHRAYARNAEAGLQFLATHQSTEVTAERLAAGTSFVAEIDGALAGVVTVQLHRPRTYGEYEAVHALASFGQFAVDPGCRGLGVGDALLARVEQAARDDGCLELALDTAQPATDLIAYYEARGFRIVGCADWRPVVNYESWIMVKRLEPNHVPVA